MKSAVSRCPAGGGRLGIVSKSKYAPITFAFWIDANICIPHPNRLLKIGEKRR